MRHAVRRLLMLCLPFAAFACSTSQAAMADLPAPKEDLPAPKDATTATAVFAGGCFWCTEGVFEQLKGVTDVTSGFAGGTKETANYERVCQGDTGHAESIRITYDPTKISYGKLLQIFFTIHDPTTKDSQGPDYGHQYRSAIFYETPDQKRVAEAYIKQLADAKTFDAPIVTTLEPLPAFYPAEAYHQDYVVNHMDSPYVCQNSLPKIEKVRTKFPELVKPAQPPK
jgi:peptide-methionine (S)-S-oxide reductase